MTNIVTTTYVDRPEVMETYADHFARGVHDGHTVRLDFCVTRYDDPKPPKPPTAKQLPVCRLALAPPAVLGLHKFLSELIVELEKQGVVRRTAPGSDTKQ